MRSDWTNTLVYSDVSFLTCAWKTSVIKRFAYMGYKYFFLVYPQTRAILAHIIVRRPQQFKYDLSKYKSVKFKYNSALQHPPLYGFATDPVFLNWLIILCLEKSDDTWIFLNYYHLATTGLNIKSMTEHIIILVPLHGSLGLSCTLLQ